MIVKRTGIYRKRYRKEILLRMAQTVALVNALPHVHAAIFAILLPGGRLVTHRDPFAGSLRYHLGLITPNRAGTEA
jgi:aspartyl/asparaginyl beta-hydroxylase (cupin superfamily)